MCKNAKKTCAGGGIYYLPGAIKAQELVRNAFRSPLFHESAVRVPAGTEPKDLALDIAAACIRIFERNLAKVCVLDVHYMFLFLSDLRSLKQCIRMDQGVCIHRQFIQVKIQIFVFFWLLLSNLGYIHMHLSLICDGQNKRQTRLTNMIHTSCA